MIDHVTIRVSDVEKSKLFYEKAFSPLGYQWSFGDDGVFHAFDIGNKCLFEIAQYQNKGGITSSHIAFRVASRELVDNFYKAALDAGASCNGKPGPRPEYTDTYYACFVHDPDGHNIEAMIDELPNKE